MNGLINVLKPPGVSSHDVIVELRHLFKIKKIGHTGTLDPGATGVLPICVGQGTRVAEYLINRPKKYRAEITFGIRTDTFDAGGEVIKRNKGVRLELTDIIDVLEDFKGEIKQVPPMVSAVHYQGKRLYQLARQGKVVERKARRVKIYQIEIIQFDGDLPYPRLYIDLECSKGTYVRSICEQVGERLGCGAYLSFLVRTKSGPFSLEESYTLEEIRDMWQKKDLSFLLPIDYALSHLPALTVKEKAVPYILNGLPLAPSGILGGVGRELPNFVRLYSPERKLLALANLCTNSDGEWHYKLKKVFSSQYINSER